MKEIIKKVNLGIVKITTHKNGVPKGLILKRDITTREAKYILSTLLGFVLYAPGDLPDRELYREILNDYKVVVNKWLRGETSDGDVAEVAYGDSGEQVGLMNMIPIISYLKKKGIIE